MSGHSHWSSIKHKKEITDAKKSKNFSKLSHLISVSAREGGKDMNFNPRLKMAVDKARSFNVPADKIERAIKKGTGEIKGMILEEITYEAYGPGGVAIIIEAITDNKNRSLGNVKQILAQDGGKLANEGSVKWMFERKGCIVLQITDQHEHINKDRDEWELLVIESGAEDIDWENQSLNVYVKVEDLEKTRKGLESKNIKIESASLDWVAKEKVKLEEKENEKCQKLFEALDDDDMVQDIYSNLSN